MEDLARQAKSAHIRAFIETPITPLTYTQGLAFQAHSLQIILLGPFTYEPNVILGSLNNRVPTVFLPTSLLKNTKYFNTYTHKGENVLKKLTVVYIQNGLTL